MQLSRDHGNSFVPMLVGRQGTRKSTFCNMLLPPELRDYYIDDIKLDNTEQTERMASFIATTNDPQPLCDPTGSRRYLCCEVEGIIDTDTPIDYGQLYAQAVYELQHVATWYLTREEEAQLEAHNTEYRVKTPPEQVLMGGTSLHHAARLISCAL